MRWSFAQGNVATFEGYHFSSDFKELLQKDVISADKLQALISDEDCLNPDLIMQLRSNRVRTARNKNGFSISNARKKIKQEETIKKNEKRRQMALVNREIIKLNKEFDDKQKCNTKEIKIKQYENRIKHCKHNNLVKVEKLRTRKALKLANCPNNTINNFSSQVLKNDITQKEDKAKCYISQSCNINEDVSLIIDSFQNNTKESSKCDNIDGDVIESANIVKESNVARENKLNITKLEQKYFSMWIQVIEKRRKIKNMMEINCRRQCEVNNFFELLKRQKKLFKKCENEAQFPKFNDQSKLVCPDVSSGHPKGNELGSFRHRYMIQKNVIALQKCKLEEQNRIIEELKLNKIVDAAKQSMNHLKDEVKESYHTFDRNNKPRVKCLSNIAAVQPEETEETTNDTLELHCLKVPKFIQKMEQRAKEREEKHAIIRERRKQIEEERVRLKQQAELLKIEMDEEEKRKRIEELREKRRAEKMEKMKRRKEQERTRTLTVMADLHYEKKLLRLMIETWRHEVKLTKQKVKLAKKHRKEKLTRSCFKLWKKHTDSTWLEIKAKADNFYNYKQLDRSMAAWKMMTYETVLNKQVAEDWYDFHLSERVFWQLRAYTLSMRDFRKHQWDMTRRHYEGKLVWSAWCSWRTLPAINALKREQEARKMKWRQKVLQVVPDYVPPEDY